MKKAFVGFGLFAAGGVCALLLVWPAAMGTPAQAQTDTAPPAISASTSGSGRYQTLTQNSFTIVLTNTVTGRVWTNNINGGNWTSLGSPVQGK